MTVSLGVDIGLAILVLAVTVWTITVRETFAAVVGFVVYGLLLALVWVRLWAIDIALTEAAIGSGVTGALLLGAASRTRRARDTPETPTFIVRLAVGLLCALISMGLAAVVLLLPEPAPTLAPEAAAGLPTVGVGNPITAVLLAYRSFDTFLEKVVLLFALVGVWSLAADRNWGGAPALWQSPDRDGVLTFLGQTLPPIGVVIAIYMLWTGADHPGGAFQASAMLAAMWMLTIIAGLTHVPRISKHQPAAHTCHRRGGFSAGRASRLFYCGRFPRLSARIFQGTDHRHRGDDDDLRRRDACASGRRSSGTRRAAMNAATVFGLCGAILVGLGLYGVIVNPQPLRKILAFNLIGGGVFLVFGVIARRGATAGFFGDPIPQAMVITGIVVAFSATALAVTLMLRLFQLSGRMALTPEPSTEAHSRGADG